MCIVDSFVYCGQLCVLETAMCIVDSYVYCGKLCVLWTTMCIVDSYVYQKDVLCIFIYESYVTSVRRYYFVRNYAAIPVQLEIVVLQYTSRCVPTEWLLSSIESAASASFWWIPSATPSCLYTYSVAASCSHAAVMFWIVSDSFPQLLHSSSMFGCFKIYLF